MSSILKRLKKKKPECHWCNAEHGGKNYMRRKRYPGTDQYYWICPKCGNHWAERKIMY